MIIGIAGPYSASTPAQREKNFDALNEAAARLLEMGHIPLIGVNAALPVVERSEVDDEYKAIMDISLAMLGNCQAVLLVGDSSASQAEIEVVREKGLPVYTKLEDVPPIES